ncbi:MAG: DUF167 family protein [Legionellaceae bacterium]|nr:DUF167 family protein [Legionellaceae bacterium]
MMAVKRCNKESASSVSQKMSSFFVWDGDILVLNVLGTPGAKQDAIGKVKGNQLKISVTAAPRAGRATDHMLRFLAKEFDVACSDIEVVFGRMNVNKQLRIKAPKQLPSMIPRHERMDK